jgi:NAD(P)H dehydrogenase (quinone)
MAQTKFLITGATGATGGYTVRQLLAKKQAVRVLAHRADDRSKQLRELGAEVVLGDFLDFDAIRAALQGVQRAYFCYPISPGIVQASAQFAQAAKEAGVEVIVNMSQKSGRSDAKKSGTLRSRPRIRPVLSSLSSRTLHHISPRVIRFSVRSSSLIRRSRR